MSFLALAVVRQVEGVQAEVGKNDCFHKGCSKMEQPFLMMEERIIWCKKCYKEGI